MDNRKAKFHSRKIVLVLIDLLCFIVIAGVYFLCSQIFAGSIRYTNEVFLIDAVILYASIMVMRLVLRIYNNVWRYTNSTVYIKLVTADCIGGLVAMFICFFLGINAGIMFFLNIASLYDLLTLVTRFEYRSLYKKRHSISPDDTQKIKVAIVGAGQIGAMLADELNYNGNSLYKPMFFIDTDQSKINGKMCGLKVYAENDMVLDVIRNEGVSEVIITLSRIDGEKTAEMYAFYSQAGCKVKVYDTPVSEARNADGQSRKTIRNFEIEDLLFRSPLKFGEKDNKKFYSGKKVLITGGGGSIGSELCRQVAKCSPAQLVIVDIYENNAYDIQQELIREYGSSLNLSVEIASVRDRGRLECIFANYKPDIVFHAAAHKHVPLMEHSGCEAIKNNILGTYNTADMAEKYNVKKFILISTDKAVNPTNIMGASKRFCEMIVQCRADSKTSFAAVRFGNVLGSNGSVIPLFRRQIERGGPVTVTDKRIIRYFMTIPEASQLVMHAGVMAAKGELFVLDMGKPVRIYDLAENMIRLSGLRPNIDIMIEEIGLRPGEKLYEELLIKTETMDKTENNMIFIERDTPFSRSQIDDKIETLKKALESSSMELSSVKIKSAMMDVVPSFRDPSEVNSEVAKKMEQAAEKKKMPIPV